MNTNERTLLLNKAWEHIDQEEYPLAIEIADKLVNLIGNDCDAREVLGYAYYSWNSYDEAIEQYKACIKLDPKVSVFYRQLSNIYYDCNDLDMAENYAMKSLSISNSEEDIRLLGSILLDKGEFDTALEYLKSLINEEEDDEDLRYDISFCLYKMAWRYCYYDDMGNAYCIDPNETKQMLTLLEEAKGYYSNKDIEDAIKFASRGLGKKLDKEKLVYLGIPAVAALLFERFHPLVVPACIIIAVLWIVLCMRPQWRLNRNELFNEMTFFDRATKFAGIIITIVMAIVGFILALLAAGTDNDDKRKGIWS